MKQQENKVYYNINTGIFIQICILFIWFIKGNHLFINMNVGIIRNDALLCVDLEIPAESEDSWIWSNVDKIWEVFPELCRGFLQVVVRNHGEQVVDLMRGDTGTKEVTHI